MNVAWEKEQRESEATTIRPQEADVDPPTMASLYASTPMFDDGYGGALHVSTSDQRDAGRDVLLWFASIQTPDENANSMPTAGRALAYRQAEHQAD